MAHGESKGSPMWSFLTFIFYSMSWTVMFMVCATIFTGEQVLTPEHFAVIYLGGAASLSCYRWSKSKNGGH